MPFLTDVSETMLWALHNRATDTRYFGEPAGSLAARAAAIDRTLPGQPQ
jgi:hypothetical protein